MTIFELGALGEILGAIGVVMTLIYLAVQIRQNTRSIQSATEFDVMNAWNNLHNLRASHSELNEIFVKGWLGDTLSNLDQVRFNSLCYSQFNIYQSIFYQHKRTVLNQELWEGFNQGLAEILRNKPIQTWIKNNRLGFGSSFLRHVDDLLEENAE